MTTQTLHPNARNQLLEEIAEQEELPYWTMNVTHSGRVKETFGDDMPKLACGRILDMGCSTGLTTQELQEYYPDSEVIGIDIHRNSVREAARKRKGKFLVADGYRMPFPENTFDLIFCMNNISLAYGRKMGESVYKRMLKTNGETLKQGGRLLVSGINEYVIFTKTKDGFVQGPSSIKIVVFGNQDINYDVANDSLCQIAHALTGEYPPITVTRISCPPNMVDSGLLKINDSFDKKPRKNIPCYKEPYQIPRISFGENNLNFYNSLAGNILLNNFKESKKKKSERIQSKEPVELDFLVGREE